MSTSTVSITANPATRRRTLVLPEKKDNGVVAVSQPNGAGSGKDLSHQSERSFKDLVQVKKIDGTNSTESLQRTRKVSRKKERPLWSTVVRVFTKNFLLVVVLLGLVQLIRKLTLRSGEGLVGTPMEIAEVEGRFAEVESFVKKTTKMMQLQVEVVDKKIENEIRGLRREMNNKIEDNGASVEARVKKLDERTEGLEKSLAELRALDWMKKEEFDKLYEDLKKTKSDEFSDGNVNLDAVKAYAREMVEKEIEKHAADGIGRVDYALAAGGARVVRHSESYIAGRGSNWFSKGKDGVHSDAEKMLKPSFGEPGQCFALKGSSGFVQIRLRTAIVPEAVTLEHVAKSVAYDRSSAAKDCRISGWLQGDDLESTTDTIKMFPLAEFTYDLERTNAQTFNVFDTAASGLVNTIRFDFTSNHGSPSHTCIYRLRLHGHKPDSVLAMQA